MENWIEELHQKYPHLFAADEEGRRLRGIEVAPGWQRVVGGLLERIEEIRGNNDNPPVKIFLIKQKYARFTVYFDCPPVIRDLLGKTVAYGCGQADLTCYHCGALGEWPLTDDGWVVRLCDSCREEFLLGDSPAQP